MLKKFFGIILFLFLGVGTGVAFIKLSSPQTPIDEIIYSPISKLVKKPQVIGFLPYWLADKAEESYKPYLSTLAYYALTINPDGTIQQRVNNIEEEPGWTTLSLPKLENKLTRAKKDNLNTSLLIFTVNEDDIANIISNPQQSAQNLLTDVTPIMERYGFKDLNMDIESFTKASPSSQLKYAEFLKEVKKMLSENKLGTLTVDITPESLIKPRLTRASLVSEIADYIVLMGYDYHFIYSLRSGPVAPIAGGGTVREYDVETAIKIALQNIPAEKLILGIPLYGYEWETISDNPIAGVIPGSGKVASSRRVSEILASCENCTKGTDETGQQPYVIIPEDKYFRQIFYEDEQSLSKKLDLSKKYKLGGVAFWALGYEDSTILNPLKNYK